jgi:catechol 2,3-dioxygenase-like lactoylglutathione lyase family enzyme
MAVTFQLDHVVIRVKDLDAASADYRALGFAVTPGGEHPTFGSRNALIPFEDGSYLELITFRNPVPAALTESPSAVMRRVRGWEAAEEGLVDFAVVPSNVTDAIRDAKARGLELEGPFPGGRRRPDGQEVAWQFGISATGDLPFLCADVTSRELRVPPGEARRHANGVVGLYRVVVSVADQDESSARYRALFGTDPQSAPSVLAAPDAVDFALGSAGIVLASTGGKGAPGGISSPRQLGPAILYVQVKGERANRPLDPALTHHVPIVCL